MESGAFGAFIWVATLVGVVILFVRLRKRRGRIGPGAAGAMYDLLNEDRRNAIEIIVEERAEARDPEDKDGNLPDLAGGRRKPPRPS